MNILSYLLPALRILMGAALTVIAGEKLLSPYQNFLYAVQSYEVFPSPFDQFIALTVPWFELFLGIFLTVGLWLRWSLWGALALLTAFLTIVGQAIIRGLPLKECGCFGAMWSAPIDVTLQIDGALWLLTALMLAQIQRTENASFDKYFRGQA